MIEESFWRLLDILQGYLPSTGEQRSRGSVLNGPITKSARLSMALRLFAGGDSLDIYDNHGVSPNEVGKSVWDIVDAIHASTELDIRYPDNHQDQMKVAQGFKEKSTINIDNCAGAIDGILIWIHKPTIRDLLNNIRFGPAKFFCGRKKKIGLNMQAVCDARGTFLDVDVRLPGAASDYYAFQKSPLKAKLEERGFLYQGLALFGDNAYCNTHYMVVPFRNISKGHKDAYNFFQSQVRINIECAFGMLVHR